MSNARKSSGDKPECGMASLLFLTRKNTQPYYTTKRLIRYIYFRAKWRLLFMKKFIAHDLIVKPIVSSAAMCGC